jgi:hypothetical protein
LTPQRLVRGDMGEPDSGIGPAKMVSVLTKIGPSYVPPGKGRPSVWAREVGKGVFNAGASAVNGRFVYFNPGHASTEWSLGGGWMGDLLLSTLRWVAKDDRGCMSPSAADYSPVATVNDCGVTDTRRAAAPAAKEDPGFGSVLAGRSFLDVDVDLKPPHTLKVTRASGERVFSGTGAGGHAYHLTGMKAGAYVILVESEGNSFVRQVTLP